MLQKVGASSVDAGRSLSGMLARLSPERVGIAALVLVGLFVLFSKNSSFFNFWTDRDMVRSANLLNEFQYMAAELSYGAASRVPGGALHYLWFIPTFFSSDPNFSYKFCILLCMLAGIPFYMAMRTYFGASAAIVATAVLYASPTTFSTMMRLWNPSFQVPFLILAYAFLIHLLAGRQTWAFKWMVASLVVAMQMHVSTWLLMVALIPALVVTRTRIPAREALLAFVISVVLMLPYLIGETMTGWDNLRTMLRSQGREAVRYWDPIAGFLFNFDNSRDIWAWFAMAFSMTDNLPATPFKSPLSWIHNLAFVAGALYILLSIANWLEWGKPIARALGLSLGGASGRVVVGAVLPVFIAFAYTSYSPQLELVIYGNSRYVMFAIPGLSILAGLGAAAVIAMAGNSRVAQVVAVGIVALMTAMPLASLASSMRALDSVWSSAGRQFMGAFEIVQKDRKWTMEEVVSGLSNLRHHQPENDSWKFESIFGIGYELYRYGKVQPFARRGECVAYLTSGTTVYGDKGITEAALERSFQQPGVKIRLISQRAVGNDRLVVFERVGRPCFTTISNRYVFSPEENAMFKRYGLIALGKAEPTTATAKAGQSAFMLNLGKGIYAMVKLEMVDGKLAVEFHSNQLRGDTYNGGFLDIGMISNARLVLTTADGRTITLVIDDGLIGGKGTFTPIREQFDVPAGPWDIRFEANVFPPVPLGTWPVDFTTAQPITIEIGKQVAVGR